MLIFETPLGDAVHRYHKSIVIPFNGKRNVLSTSPINGGYREDLKAVFNHDGTSGAGMACKLKAPTYKEHMKIIIEELGLNPEDTAGISTAASMDNVAIVVESFRDLSVTAIVTGGVDVNGGRVGDPASHYELDGEFHKLGTINIIVEINVCLTPGALARALVTCTEAKTAALQELMAGSNYSSGLATGSGTDGTIMISNMDSSICLTNAGKHGKLGELIGLSVKKAVKEALYKQTGLCSESQHSVLKRVKRYGITEESLWEEYLNLFKDNSLEKPDFIHHLHCLDTDAKLVTKTSLYIHLLDQFQWELLSQQEVREEAKSILRGIHKHLSLEEDKVVILLEEGDLVKDLISCFEQVIALGVGGKVSV